jgi:Zn-dependent peptidase ImmA (M78 family)/transcriptional regulator with XRE-family HTH domain
MELTQEELARRLKQARETCGLTQADVAEELGLPRTAVTQVETGNRSVSTLELAELSRLYMRPVSDFFAEEFSVGEEPVLTLLRVQDEFADAPEVQAEISAAVAVCQDGVKLKQLLGLSEAGAPPVYEMPSPSTSAEAVGQGESVAHEERRRLGLGVSPIADMSDLINGEGVWATGTELPDEMSGLFIQHSSVGLLVLTNLHHPRVRKRFSYAHEYAHVLMDRKHGISVSTRRNTSELVEKRANAFAAALLMPRVGVFEQLVHLGKGMGSRDMRSVYDVNTGSGFDTEARKKPGSQTVTFQDVACLAHHFGVSYDAMTYRLSSLSVVNKKQREELLEKVDVGRSYLETLTGPEKEAPDRELQMEVARLAFEAYRMEEISRGRLLEICTRLGWKARDVETQMEALSQVS